MALKHDKKKICKCPFCKRSERLAAIRKKLPPADARYLMRFEEYVVANEIREFEREMLLSN